MHRKLGTILTILAAGLLSVTVVNADVLYDSTGNPRYDSTDITHSFSPYFYNVGFPSDILWDDVPITLGLNPSGSVTVTQLQFGIARAANAGAVTIDAFWAPMVADNGANRGGSNPNADPYDGPEEDPGAPVHIGQVVLGANGGSLTLAPITFGDGVNTLFSTGPLDLTYSPTVGYFMLGLRFSTGSTDNGWIIATGTNNRPKAWDDYQDAVPSTISEIDYGPDLGNVPILGTQSIKVVGTVVPEPASLSLLALGGLVGLRRRRA